MPDLTQREREILELIARWIDANGYQPSYREIARHFGWASLGWLHVLSRSLTRKGVVVVKGARAWAFDWKHYTYKEVVDATHNSEGTDGSCSRRLPRRDVRRGTRRRGNRSHRMARTSGGGLG